MIHLRRRTPGDPRRPGRLIDKCRLLRLFLRSLVFPSDTPRNGVFQQFAVHTVDWIVIAALTHRIILTPIALVAVADALGASAWRHVWVAGALILYSAVLAVGVATGRLRRLLQARVFFPVDVGACVLVNIWASAALTPDTLAVPFMDMFWGYAMGTVAMWTALRGARVGCLLLAGSVGLLAAMNWANGVAPTGQALLVNAGRAGRRAGAGVAGHA